MNYVTYNYMGGLGNQLFGIYSAISFGIDHNKESIFEFKKISPSITHRLTYWDSILKNLKTIDTADFNKINWSVIKENSDGTYNIPLEIYNNICFEGYFQNINNFLKNLENINNILNINEFKSLYKNKNLDLFKNSTIGIHFRLGDYKYLQNHHPLLTNQYYINALNQIEDIENFNILVFCEKEDYDLIEKRMNEILNNLEKNINFQIIKNKNDLEELFLLSCCEKIIIANSTFSWWSAIYSGHNNIFIPNKWFHNMTPTGLVLKDWKLIEF